MAKQNNLGIWVIVMILIVLFLPKYGLFFVITGEERMTRSMVSPVEPGKTHGVNYKVSGVSGNWAVSIVDTLKCPGQSDITKRIVMISPGTSLISLWARVPDTETTCTLSGNYQFGDKPIRNFATRTIIVKEPCISHSTYKCYYNDVYWYDSCGVKEEKKEDCLYQCVIVLGGNDKCSISEADTNGDGIVDRTELGIYITKWINNQITRTKLGQAIQIWASS